MLRALVPYIRYDYTVLVQYSTIVFYVVKDDFQHENCMY
jgi:hypothetical protein